MRGKAWTEADSAMLRSMYADHTNAVIAAKLERTVVSVDQKAHLMGLKKPAAYHAAQPPLAERFTPNYAFKPVGTSDLPQAASTFRAYVPRPHPRQADMAAFRSVPSLYR